MEEVLCLATPARVAWSSGGDTDQRFLSQTMCPVVGSGCISAAGGQGIHEVLRANLCGDLQVGGRCRDGLAIGALQPRQQLGLLCLEFGIRENAAFPELGELADQRDDLFRGCGRRRGLWLGGFARGSCILRCRDGLADAGAGEGDISADCSLAAGVSGEEPGCLTASGSLLGLAGIRVKSATFTSPFWLTKVSD